MDIDWAVRLADPLRTLAELVEMIPGAVEIPAPRVEVAQEVDDDPLNFPTVLADTDTSMALAELVTRAG